MRFIPWSSFWNKITEFWKVITISVISENVNPIYRIVSEKFSPKNSNQRIYEFISVLVLTERAKNHRNCSKYQELPTLEPSLYIPRCLLMVNSYANEQKCKQWRKDAPIQQHVKNSIWSMRSKLHIFSSKGWTNWKNCNKPFISFHFISCIQTNLQMIIVSYYHYTTITETKD